MVSVQGMLLLQEEKELPDSAVMLCLTLSQFDIVANTIGLLLLFQSLQDSSFVVSHLRM